MRSYDGEDYSDEESVSVTVMNVNNAECDDEWYDESVYLGGLTGGIIVIVIVVAILFSRNRNAEYYEDWGDEEDSDEEW